MTGKPKVSGEDVVAFGKVQKSDDDHVNCFLNTNIGIDCFAERRTKLLYPFAIQLVGNFFFVKKMVVDRTNTTTRTPTDIGNVGIEVALVYEEFKGGT